MSKLHYRFATRLSVPLTVLACALHVGCAIPSYLRVEGLEQEEDGHELVIHVDEHGNVARGDSNDVPLVPPRAASTVGHQAKHEVSPTSPDDGEALKPAIPQPVEPVASGTSLSQQSDDFHNRLAQLRQAAQPTPVPSQNLTSQTEVRNPELEVPAGVEPTIVRSPRFKLDYDDQLLGPNGIARVELYGTRDNGRTWQRLGEDKDRRSPYEVDVKEEGLYGFRIAVAGRNGLASRPPKDGELPELWVKVDRDVPAFKGNLRATDGELLVKDESLPNATNQSQEPTPSDRNADNRVIQTSAQEPVDDLKPPNMEESDDWRAHLDRAIVDIELQLSGSVASGADNDEQNAGDLALSEDDKNRLAARLRMLQLARGRHELAIQNSPHHSTEENEYWSHQVHGMHLLISDDDRLPFPRRSSAALTEVRDAADKLAAFSELQIANLTFCTAAHSFGVYETTIADDRWRNKDYRQAKFEPEQPVILYFEVNNFLSEQHTSRDYPDGAWRTSFKGSYTILDRDGKPLDRRELQLRDDLCRNRRRDYFVAYKTWMPQINPGHYTLELLIEDQIAGKIGTSTIDFEIVAK